MAEDRGEPRPEKVAIVDEIEARLNAAVSALFVEMHGITVAEVGELRNQLRDAGVSFRVYKNTMVNLAAQRIGLEGMEEYLTGPTAIAVSPDEPATAARAISRSRMEVTNERGRSLWDTRLPSGSGSRS